MRQSSGPGAGFVEGRGNVHPFSHVIVVLAGAIVQPLLFAALTLLLLHGVLGSWMWRRRIQEQGARWSVWRHELVFAILAFLSAGLVRLLIEGLHERGFIRFRSGPVSLALLLSQLALYFLLFDFCNYWFHRWMHTGWRYRFHQVHHVSRTPNALSALSFHPLEALVTSGFTLVLLVAMDFHVHALLAISVLGMLQNLMIHCGHELLPWWWHRNPLTRLLVSPTYHDRHHELADRNFGGLTTLWDRLFGTSEPDFELRYDAVHARIRSAASPSRIPELEGGEGIPAEAPQAGLRD
ncbi:sterol desaturase family protein [Pyxidicoccus sp. MSG2]|uniref:sterol desaturase family protein n=1 Tax=Pyxidicoccus sp. MSG2 TaxID=2996790 RepID=UPI00226E1FFE|nr:sterol desaturase family protein [Pyxidicoccus sp. MSG2]MCY1014423.1 sterol desaturase family protein [Pyxidicoccus sp. MSG2]